MALTIRLSEEQDKMIKDMMEEREIATASKAIKTLIHEYRPMTEYETAMAIENKELAEELKTIKDLIRERQRTKRQVNQIQSRLSALANK